MVLQREDEGEDKKLLYAMEKMNSFVFLCLPKKNTVYLRGHP